jgi:hypothetical protein
MVQLVYIAMDDLTGRKLPGCEDLVIDSYRKVILSRQEIVVLYEEDHVQRAYELVIEALGDSEQLKLGRALTTGDFDFVAATSPDIEIPIECLPIVDINEGSSSVPPPPPPTTALKKEGEAEGSSTEDGKDGKAKEEVKEEEMSWQTVFSYRLKALQAELEQQQQQTSSLSSMSVDGGGGGGGGGNSNATLNRRHRMEGSNSWTPSTPASGMQSGAGTPMSGASLSNRSIGVSTPVISRSGSPTGQAALLMRTSAAALNSGAGTGTGNNSPQMSASMAASRSGADTPNGSNLSNRSWAQYFAGGGNK